MCTIRVEVFPWSHEQASLNFAFGAVNSAFIEVLFTTLEAQRLNLRGISTQTVLTNPIESAILRDVE